MHATMLCLATVAFGVDWGCRPLPEGGIEYIIQIEPDMLPKLAKGEPLFSDIPPNLRDVRSYRIIVGTEELPREGQVEQEPAASSVLTPPRDGEPDPSPLLTPPGYDEPGVPPAFAGPRYAGPAPTPGPAEVADGPTAPSETSPSDSLPWDTPRPLRLPTGTEPLSESGEKPALFVDQEQEPAEPSGAEPEKQREEVESQETDKPSGPFTLALAGFLGSFGVQPSAVYRCRRS